MASSEYKLAVVNGTSLSLSLNGPAGPTGATGGVTSVAGRTGPVTLVSADITDATEVAEANTVAKRDSTGGGVYFGTAESDFGVAGEGAAYGVYGFCYDSIAIGGETATGTGLSANSNSGTGASISTVSGTYHALFGNTGSNRSFVALLNGAFGWFRGAFTGRILAPATLAANVTWTLPTTGGNLARVASVAGTIVSADVSDASTGGFGTVDAGKLSKFGADGGLRAYNANGNGITALSNVGVGLYAESQIGEAIKATSNLATGLIAETTTGDYHAEFGSTGNNHSFVSLLNGAFGWFRGIYTGRIQAQTSLTGNRIYTLPDSTGTLPTVPPYGDITEANAAALGAGTFFWDTTLKKLRVTTA